MLRAAIAPLAAIVLRGMAAQSVLNFFFNGAAQLRASSGSLFKHNLESPAPAADGENTPTPCANASNADARSKRLHRRHLHRRRPSQAPPQQSARLHHARCDLSHPTLCALNSTDLSILSPSKEAAAIHGITVQPQIFKLKIMRWMLKSQSSSDNHGYLFKLNSTDKVAYHKYYLLRNGHGLHGAEKLLQQQIIRLGIRRSWTKKIETNFN